MSKQLILCDCLGTQSIDGPALGTATGLPCSRVHTSLCDTELATAAEAVQRGDVVIACGQEQARFLELAEELGAPAPGFVDLRDRAGWSADPASKTPKMAALIAEAGLPVPVDKTVDIPSEGMCLIIGPGAHILPVAEQLSEFLSVTACLTDDTDPPPSADYEIVRGAVKRAEGAFGGFSLRIDQLQAMIPGGRGAPEFTPPKNGARTECDIVIDLTGGTPLFPAHHKRDGYFRPDPGNPAAIAAAVTEASHMSGTFEKTLHVRVEESLCAHSRAGQIGCTRCLDICPTGAITPAGDHVSVDPMVCAGCGGCSALCPSGAISYDAPPPADTFRRAEILARAYRNAGGTDPVLLVHDDDHGAEMIRLAARYGDGLPANVIPLAVVALGGFGHAEALAALGAGFTRVDILPGPHADRDVMDREIALSRAIAGDASVRALDVTDPADLTAAVTGDNPVRVADTILPMGSRRQVARLAAQAIAGEAILPLPPGAPYGDVDVNTDTCTLCLSCVSLCPSGALGENPDKPQLLFQEDACLQCGLCVTICPENAITLAPRLDLTDAALGQQVKNEQEPFACVECGALFGVKATIEKITEKLAGKHSMFANPEAARMIQMCDNCRVQAQYHSENSPLKGADRPRTRTTDDYLSKRRDH